MSEVLIVGGGIMGLWAALMAGRAGIETRLLERQNLGAGASGGLLGALMPHMPDRWGAKKQLQFDALVSLESEIAQIEDATGLSAGYRRSGRLMPLGKPHLREIALGHEQDAARHWIADGRRYFWHVHNADAACGWPVADAASFGLVHDTLAARVAPRSLLQALRAALDQFPLVRVEEGAEVSSIDPRRGRLMLTDGRALSFGYCILSAGVESFSFLDRLVATKAPSGSAVKGQAALLRADVDPSSPVIFTDGLYIVAHENGHVAIGSTSENHFEEPFSTDGQLDALIRRAEILVPALRAAPVIERWAGLRPKAAGRDPMVGRHPDHEKLFVLTGGFKVSFGIAHVLARFVIDDIAGRSTIDLPDSFRCAVQIAALR